MIGQFQIPRNYVAWSYCQPPYMLQNSSVFSRPPTFNGKPPCPVNYTGRVKCNRNKPERRNHTRRANAFENPNGSLETNRFTRKARRFPFPKRMFTGVGHFSAPFAPRNMTSFIIRAKKSGGISSVVSPCAVTPTILTTPVLSSSTEVVVEMGKEEWGIDGYGTMNGLIRVRSSQENSDETENDGSDCEYLEVEKRLNTDLRRFEMVYPSEYSIKNRVDKHELHISRLEEQNLSLKKRIFLIEDELGELRRRVLCLETEGMRLQDFNRDNVYSEKSV